MTPDDLLAQYVRLAEVLGRMFAPVLETVVHDLRQPEASIIAIHNAQVTGRSVGDGATDYGRRLMEGDFPDVLVGYANESPSGRPLKSSSVAIRMPDGTLVGVLGLNLDVHYFSQFSTFLEAFVTRSQSPLTADAEQFTAPPAVASPAEALRVAVDRVLVREGWAGQALTNAQKRHVVEQLYAEGLFRTRGAVTHLADHLGLTRATVYNYRNAYRDRLGDAEDM